MIVAAWKSFPGFFTIDKIFGLANRLADWLSDWLIEIGSDWIGLDWFGSFSFGIESFLFVGLVAS